MSKTLFKPYSLTKAELDAIAIQNGNMYVITNTNELVFDIEGKRIIVKDNNKTTMEEVNAAIDSALANIARAEEVAW